MIDCKEFAFGVTTVEEPVAGRGGRRGCGAHALVRLNARREIPVARAAIRLGFWCLLSGRNRNFPICNTKIVLAATP